MFQHNAFAFNAYQMGFPGAGLSDKKKRRQKILDEVDRLNALNAQPIEQAKTYAKKLKPTITKALQTTDLTEEEMIVLLMALHD